MPRYFGIHHDEYIAQWKKSGTSSKLNKTNYLWGVAKSGHCFSMLIYNKLVPLLHENNFAFFSAIEKLDDQKEVICSQFGEIYGAGKILCKTLNISPFLLQ
jgi:hypothetical protein